VGLKAGPGQLIVTVRYGESITDEDNHDDEELWSVGIGYKYELFTK
jgi:hypothetical protein